MNKDYQKLSRNYGRQRPLTTSQSLVFVRAVRAVVLAIADPPAADAAPVATRELVAMARPVGMRADVYWLVTGIAAVVFTVAVPARWDASVSRLAAKIIYSTRHNSTLL